MSSTPIVVLELDPHDDLATIRRAFAGIAERRVALVLPWELHFLSEALDFDLLRREAQRRRMEVAIVSPDPDRRELARARGFPVFASVEDAQAQRTWETRFPEPESPPPKHWWDEEVELTPPSIQRSPSWFRWIREGGRLLIFALAVLVILGTAYVVVPRASVALVPAGQEFETIVPVSVDPEGQQVNHVQRMIPARRVGVNVEDYGEIYSTGTQVRSTGRATGQVLFTNLLSQDYTVPKGTIVRTSSSGYPVRFRTTQQIVVPAAGQALAPIEAVEEGIGNVGAFQINRVEGVPSSAVRVTNPEPTKGAESEEVPIVTRSDYEHLRLMMMRHLLNLASTEMGYLVDSNEVLLRQSLRIDAVHKESYTHLVSEQSDRVGLDMRVLVSGLVVDVDEAESIAYQALSTHIPSDYTLIDAEFEIGEVAEEDIGPGPFTFFVTARGYAASKLNTGAAVDVVRGRPLSEARQRLLAEFPLADEPRINVWPEPLHRMPVLSLRIEVNVISQDQSDGDVRAAR